jgi:hypothetical protein
MKLFYSEENLTALPRRMIGCPYGIFDFIVQINSTLRAAVLGKLSFNIA